MIGGGVGIVVKNTLKIKQLPIKQFQTFECSINKLIGGSDSLTLITIYILDWESSVEFFAEFRSMVETLSSNNTNYIIAGDFNIHVDCAANPLTIKFEELTSNYNMKQWVSQSTHRLGHTLDLILTAEHGIRITEIEVKHVSLSDHFLIHFTTTANAKRVSYKDIYVRNYKNINH